MRLVKPILVLALGGLFLASFVNAFSCTRAAPLTGVVTRNYHPKLSSLVWLGARTEGEEAEEDAEDIESDDLEDDDDLPIQPYGNRSLAWTRRYRRLNPYEKVRQRVLTFGHRSKEDWDDCVASGLQGAYVPQRPDQMYAPEWISWDEFLGIMRSYDETRHVAVNVLGLKSLDDYILFVRSDPKRAQGLRIPVRPDLKYQGQGWVDEATFFNRSDDSS